MAPTLAKPEPPKLNWLTQDTFVEMIVTSGKREAEESTTMPVCFMGGWPFMGKTTIIKKVVERLPGSVHLPAESYILSRAIREKKRIDGCAKECHQMSLLELNVNQLRYFQSVVVEQYNWQKGQTAGPALKLTPAKGGIILVDGTVSTLMRREVCDAGFIFQPDHPPSWIERAVMRDTAERNWDEHVVYSRNIAKARTSQRYKDETAGKDFVVSVHTDLSHYAIVRFPGA